MICLACNNTKSRDVEQILDGDTLEMFNFVCCLDLSQVDLIKKKIEQFFSFPTKLDK